MVGMNEVRLIGRLMEEPRVFGEDQRSSVVSIMISVPEEYTDRGGKKVRRFENFKVKLFGEAATYAAVNLGEQSLVLVKGKLRNEKWVV